MAYISSNNRTTLSPYFTDLGAIGAAPLSYTEEAALSARIKAGDTDARDRLVEANLAFVVDFAKKYQNRGLPLSDLVGAGNVGLMTAVDRFDGQRGFKFISYAVWWIRQAILLELATAGRLVRLPQNQIGNLCEVLRVQARLFEELGREPEGGEIFENLHKKSQVQLEPVWGKILPHLRSPIALDAPVQATDNDKTYRDILPDPLAADPAAEAGGQDAGSRIRQALSNLTDRERHIIVRYYGLHGEVPQTLDEIGETLGITRERVRQIRNKSLKVLRHKTETKGDPHGLAELFAELN